MKTPWETLYERFDPERPAIDRAWRVEHPYSPTKGIDTALERKFGDKRYLVLGSVGSGKSTELYALAERRAQGDMVVVIDLYRHIGERVGDANALENLQPWEAVFLCGVHVFAAAERVLGHRWDPRRKAELEAARAAFEGEGEARLKVDLGKLAAAITVVAGTMMDGGTGLAIKTLGPAVGATEWKLPIGLPGRSNRPDQDEQVKRVAAAVSALIVDLRESYHKPVTLIIDGLDRVRTPETIRRLFVESSLLGELPAATVLTGPVSLRQHGLASRIRSFDPKVLANVPVLDQADPMQPGAKGIAFFREVFARRTRDLGAEGAIPDELLTRMAYYSGGRIRDFVRLVRMTAEQAYDRRLEVADQQAVDAAIDERRRVVEMGLNERHVEILRHVMSSGDRLLPADAEVDEMLSRFWLLPYPNESEWYYPHPLLTLNRVRLAGSPG